jgi:hypothetical protein
MSSAPHRLLSFTVPPTPQHQHNLPNDTQPSTLKPLQPFLPLLSTIPLLLDTPRNRRRRTFHGLTGTPTRRLGTIFPLLGFRTVLLRSPGRRTGDRVLFVRSRGSRA